MPLVTELHRFLQDAEQWEPLSLDLRRPYTERIQRRRKKRPISLWKIKRRDPERPSLVSTSSLAYAVHSLRLLGIYSKSWKTLDSASFALGRRRRCNIPILLPRFMVPFQRGFLVGASISRIARKKCYKLETLHSFTMSKSRCINALPTCTQHRCSFQHNISRWSDRNQNLYHRLWKRGARLVNLPTLLISLSGDGEWNLRVCPGEIQYPSQ